MNTKQPRTLAELKKHRYAISPRMPKGQSYAPEQCGWIVHECKKHSVTWQCNRASGYGEGKLWCSNHAKVALNA